MALSADIGGQAEFQKLAARLGKAAHDDVITAAIGRAVEASEPEIRAVIKAGAISTLPRGGGLAERVARTQIARRITRRQGFYRLVLIARTNAVKDPGAINRGRVRHPVYGRPPKGEPIIQKVRPGWFSNAIRGYAPTLRTRVIAAARKALSDI